jgi:tetratricopeptide (TPR) repeat protein
MIAPGLRRMIGTAVFLAAVLCIFPAKAATTAAHQLLSFEGKVEIARMGANNWDPASTNMNLNAGDRVRTGVDSRALVRLSTRANLPISELTVITLGGAGTESEGASFDLEVGRAFFLGNDKPGKTKFRTRSIAGAVRGTEFHIEVAEDGTTTLALFDGAVDLENEKGKLALQSGQGAMVENGKAPELRPLIEARRGVQWYLYYPAIVAPEDFGAMNEGVEAYAKGDLTGASQFEGAGLLRAATALGVGQVGKAEEALKGIDSEVADAIRLLISVVTQPTNLPPRREWKTASGWLAESYREQAALDLPKALSAAQKAVSILTNFGAGWIRVAELEFGFGKIGAAREALKRGLELSPMNAQGWALNGFLLAANNEFSDAEKSFERAIQTDGALGNSWLGRGLIRIRRGDSQGGFSDLQTAAVLDPQRSFTRSYLAKALDAVGESAAVEQELERAMELDPNDPTAWLYAALIHHRAGRINRAIREFEEAREKNENRALFRSRLLLDQDRAVSSANLAAVYRDAGMFEVGRREAAASVQENYSSAASHLFLANSYSELQDPRRASLRFETATVSEYLLANLLAPAGVGAFSPRISQQEYSRLFERNHVGLVSETEYESNGTWRQGAAQYGVFGGTSYALEQIYRTEAAPHPNGQLEQMSFSAMFKQQLTPNDLIYVQSIYDWTETGDARQLEQPSDALTSLRARDEQLPFLLAGYNHQWQPGVNTLLIAGFVNDDYNVSLTNAPVAVFGRTADGRITRVPVAQPVAQWFYADQQRLFTAEAQQIFETGRNTLIAGARYQTADHEASSTLGRSTLFRFRTAAGIFPGSFRAAKNTQLINEDFERYSAYAYDTIEALPNLHITGGLSYDNLRAPVNYRNPPLTAGDDDTERVSPKAGVMWRATKSTLVRGAYSRSLGGTSFDQSIRIEPTQLGGINQAYRSLIPEALAGSVSGARFETFGLGVDQKIGNNLYLGLEGEWQESKAERTIGTVNFQTVFPFGQSLGTASESLRFREKSLLATVHYLLGEYFSLGARHRISDAELESVLGRVSAPFNGRTEAEATLSQTDLFVIANHPLGFFGEISGTYYNQDTVGRASGIPDDEFWQMDFSIGWRSPRRRVEVMASLLNVTDQDYRLYPLNSYRDPPRERTFATRLRFNF